MTSSQDNASNLLTLCGKVRDGDITPAEFARLEAWLLRDPQALRTYRRFMTICSGLEQTAFTQQSDSQRNQWASEVELALETRDQSLLDPVDAEARRRSGGSKKNRRGRKAQVERRRRNVAFIVTATAALAAVMLFAIVGLQHSPDSSTGFAKVESVQQPVWADEHSLSINDVASDEDYALASGAIQLRYDNGAELLVQAPARFKLVDPKQLTLTSGVASLYIPPEATGFRVDTPFGSAIDHGTRIGVAASSETGIELHVFQGKAELVAPDASEGEMLTANEAAALATDATEIARIDTQSEYFAQSLDDSANLPEVSGDVELRIRPPRSVRRVRADLVDRERVTVFAEKTSVEIQEDLPVTMTTVGEATNIEANNETLPAGTKVDSYFVHFVLPRDLWRTNDVLTASGSITFDRPIAGVIAHNPAKSGGDFENAVTDYPGDKDTGLESSINGDRQQRDQLTLSPDRRTLKFRLRLHGNDHSDTPDRVDQLRVLVKTAQ